MSNYVPPWRPSASPATHGLSSPMKLTDQSTIVPERVPQVQPTKNMRGGQAHVGPLNPEPRGDVKEAVRAGLQHYGPWGVSDRVRTLPQSSPVRQEAAKQIAEQARKFEAQCAPLVVSKKK